MTTKWTPDIFVSFVDAGGLTARQRAEALATRLGMTFNPDGSPSLGDGNFALSGPFTQWTTRPTMGSDADGKIIALDPGVSEVGEWWTLRFNLDWPGRAAAMQMLQTEGVLMPTPANPSNVFF